MSCWEIRTCCSWQRLVGSEAYLRLRVHIRRLCVCDDVAWLSNLWDCTETLLHGKTSQHLKDTQASVRSHVDLVADSMLYTANDSVICSNLLSSRQSKCTPLLAASSWNKLLVRGFKFGTVTDAIEHWRARVRCWDVLFLLHIPFKPMLQDRPEGS